MKNLQFHALLIAVFMADAEPARAQDAGTHSAFATGAGPRALAMGGAFAGVADDASALLWNPGGLGALRQSEVQAAHASYGEVGSREEYVAAAYPDWRWGAVGLSLRFFGVGGLDARDDRNLPVDDEISDSESEITIGYGMTLTAGISVGGAVKLQRQAIGSFSASGIGGDLGALVAPARLLGGGPAWLERVTWGISCRNIVEPSLRLDQDAVRDPAVLRTGFGYLQPGFLGRKVLVALDLEKPKGAGMRLHSGLEVPIHPLLGLRMGVDQGALAAGFALSWRGLQVDYTYQDVDLAGVHRIGFSRALGASVSERRQAAVHAREKVIQDRLDEAFRARQAAQLEELLRQVASAQEQGDIDGALDLLSTAAVLYPAEPRVNQLRAECLRAKGRRLEAAKDFAGAALAYGQALSFAPSDSLAATGQLRARAESDRRAARTESLRRQFARASDAFAADSLVQARRGFAAILRADSTDRDAAEMLRRTEQLIAQRVAGLVLQARQALALSQWDAATESFRQAQELNPTAPGVADGLAVLARARTQAGTATAKPPEPKVTRAERATLPRQELEQLYQAGLRASSERRSEDARRYWEIVYSADPDYRDVASYLKRECLLRGMELYASGRLEEALLSWQRILEIDPTDRRASVYIARARTQQARARELAGGGR